MSTAAKHTKPASGAPDPKDPAPFPEAMRSISKENEDLNPGSERITDGPGAPPEGAGTDAPGTSHTGQTTRGSYATDSSTGAGRYMDRSTGNFGVEPVDEQGEEDAIDPE